jgi:ribosomal protein S18 acetylase RimI-like enzyme
VEIRRIRRDEWGALRDLRLQALRDAPDAFSSTYEEESIRSDEQWMEWTADLVEGGASFGVVAVDDDDRWIGMSVGAPHRDHPGEAGLFAMWVDPAERNAGIGGALIEDVVRWARTGGFPVLRLQVTLSNDAAVRLYMRSGFSDEGRRMPLREGSGVVTTMMTMDL